MADALKKQVDGTHYNSLKYQPVWLAYVLNASPCFCKLAKYTTRTKDDPMQQLDKAIHCIELEQELLQEDTFYGMTVDQYEIAPVKHRATHIHNFSSQFKETTLIYTALTCMFLGDYEQAINAVRKMKEQL